MRRRIDPEAPVTPLYQEPDEPALPALVTLGVVVGSTWSSLWVHELLRGLREQRFIRLSFVAVSEEVTRDASGDAAWAASGISMHNGLFGFYRKLDRLLNRRTAGELEASPIEPWLERANVPLMTARPGLPGTPEIDVLVELDSGLSKTELSRRARRGLITYAIGEPGETRSGPPLFWRIYDRDSKAGTRIRIERWGPDGRATLASTYASTSDSVWLSRHDPRVKDRVCRLIVRTLRNLVRDARAEDGETETVPQSRHALRAPTNGAMVTFAARSAFRLARKKWNARTKDVEWFVGYRTNPEMFVANGGTVEPAEFEFIQKEPGHIYADPFVFRHEDEDFIFFEDWDQSAQRAVIAVTSIDGSGRQAPVRTVLKRDYHFSYPFVFAFEGEIYMLPDTSETKTVQVFRSRRFPDEWEEVQVLLRGYPMVDPTLYQHEGRWFLFVNVKEGRYSSLNDELFLFYGGSPFGPFIPHPENPIHSDARVSRPAGRLFIRDGMLVRPSQDCAARYGSAINLFEVELMTKTRYRERLIRRVVPRGNTFDGCHTLSFNDRIEALDLRRSTSKF